MTVSNLDDFKRKVNGSLPGMMFIFSAVLVFCCIVTFITGIPGHSEELKQLDRKISNATVAYVSEHTEMSDGHGKSGRGNYTVYDIGYQYIVNGTTYKGFYNSLHSKNVSDTFDIKYNPDSPGESTDVLKPITRYIVIGLIFGVSGVTMIISSFVINKKQRKSA